MFYISGAFKDVLDIELVGPFQILDPTRKRDELKTLEDYLTQWRFYYDPPEFQVIFFLLIYHGSLTII